jgi:hypothetical protein
MGWSSMSGHYCFDTQGWCFHSASPCFYLKSINWIFSPKIFTPFRVNESAYESISPISNPIILFKEHHPSRLLYPDHSCLQHHHDVSQTPGRDPQSPLIRGNPFPLSPYIYHTLTNLATDQSLKSPQHPPLSPPLPHPPHLVSHPQNPPHRTRTRPLPHPALVRRIHFR